MADAPYTRLYHKLADEYPDIYDDAGLLGTFVQLLIHADQTWPTVAHVPALVEPERLAVLVDAGLVVLEGKRYRMRGLDKERKRRSRHASKAASARWADDEQEARNALSNARSMVLGNAQSTAQTMPSRAKPSRDEPSQTEPNQTARDRSRRKTGPETVAKVLGYQP